MGEETSQSTSTETLISLDEEEIAIPNNLRFILDGLKLLTQHPLTSENHIIWSSQIETIFLANGFEKFLDPNIPPPNKFTTNKEGSQIINPYYKKWNLINRNLIVAVIATISPTIQTFVLRKETIAEIWIALKIRLQSQSRSRIIQLKEELHSLSMKGENMAAYLTTIKSILDQLEAAGSHVEDEDIMIYAMNGLPNLYNGFKTAFRLKTEKIDLNTFYSLLLTEEINLGRQAKSEGFSQSLAMVAPQNRNQHQQGRPNYNYNQNRGRDRNNTSNYKGKPKNQQNGSRTNGVECQICKKMGHTADKCWYRHHDSSNQSTKTAYAAENQQTKGLFDEVGSSQGAPDEWYLDSGASANLTNQFQHLQTPSNYQGRDSITVGNGTKLPITHTGHHTITTPTCKLYLPELLYVPSLKHNLISVYHLTSNNNCRIIFDSLGFLIQDKKTNKIIHQGRTTNGLYPIHSKIESFSATLHQSNPWHARLGHPNQDIMKTLSTNCDCISFQSSIYNCNACDTSKSHKLSFPVSTIKTMFPFELVHSDVWGPSPFASNQNCRYFLIFIDDYSRYTWLFPIQNKSETFQIFQNFFNMIHNQFNTKIKILRTDNGGEYTSNEFNSFIHDKGIIHQFSCPHTPEQNGVAERKNRHILETTRTLLSHASLPQSYWLEAATTATYLINRLPTKTLDLQSPYQKLYNKPPSYNHLKVFGCLCYPWLAYTRKHKLDPKSHPCIFLGYSSAHKGFRCYDTSSKRLIISRHVKFYEHIFPSSSHPSPNPTNPSTSSHNIIPPISLQPYSQPTDPPPINTSLKPPLPPPPINKPPLIQYQRRQKPPQTTPSHHTTTTNPPISNNHPTPNTSSTDNTTSKHPMITRSKANQTPPPLLNLSHILADPITYKQAQPIPHWQQAMLTEIQALNKQNTWILVPKPTNHPILGSKWTYKTKLNADGSVSRYKARLVAQGYRQIQGIDYVDTFSPVAKIPTIRMFFIIAFQRAWNITQVDVSNAFLHGILDEEVYMQQPKGFEDHQHPDHVCLLKKSIYGLKQSSRQWNKALTTALHQLGFSSSSADPSLYLLHRDQVQVYILIYVDDLLIAGTDDHLIQSTIHKLSQNFKIRTLGQPKLFLGIQTILKPSGHFLHQQHYATSILQMAGLENCNHVSTPLPSKDLTNTLPTKPFNNPTLFRKIAGSLQYLVITRPDIAHAVGQACQHMHDPQDHHFALLTRILRYIKGTITYGVPITPGNLSLTAYTDSDWAGNPTDRTSTTGFCIFLGPNLLHWKSQKQKTVARSSSEAEYRALSTTITEIIWIKRLMQEFLATDNTPTKIFCDNMSAISMAKNPILKARTKHIEIDHHFIREHITNGHIQLYHIPTKEQLADIFTKRLPQQQFKELCNKLTIQPKHHELAGGC